MFGDKWIAENPDVYTEVRIAFMYGKTEQNNLLYYAISIQVH